MVAIDRMNACESTQKKKKKQFLIMIITLTTVLSGLFLNKVETLATHGKVLISVLVALCVNFVVARVLEKDRGSGEVVVGVDRDEEEEGAAMSDCGKEEGVVGVVETLTAKVSTSSRPGSPVPTNNNNNNNSNNSHNNSPSSTSTNHNNNNNNKGKNKSHHKGGGGNSLITKIDDEALEEFKLQQERLKNERLEREAMIFEREEKERIAREEKEKELIEKRRLRALEHEAELEKLRLAKLAKKEEEEKKQLEEDEKLKAKENSHHLEMQQQQQQHMSTLGGGAGMYSHDGQRVSRHSHSEPPVSPKHIPSPHFNMPKPPPGPPPEHVVQAVRNAAAANNNNNYENNNSSTKIDPPLPPMAPIYLDELHRDQKQREVLAPPTTLSGGIAGGFGSADWSRDDKKDSHHQRTNSNDTPSYLLVPHQRTDSFASESALNDVLGLTFSSLGDDVFGPFTGNDLLEEQPEQRLAPIAQQQQQQQGLPPLPPGPPPSTQNVLIPSSALFSPALPNTEVREWLRMLNLEQFAEIFERESIVMSDLVLLQERDLESLGLPLGPRRRLAASVAHMSNPTATTTTATVSTNTSSLSSFGNNIHARSPSKDGGFSLGGLYHGYSSSDGLFEVDLVNDYLPVLEEEPSLKEPSPVMLDAARKIKIASTTMKVPQEFYDCITCEVMLEPVITADGHSYDRNSIARWFLKHDTSPITGEKLAKLSLTPNHSLRSSILAWVEDHCPR